MISDPAFQAAYDAAKPHEGGYSDDPQDPGNWTGGKVGAGELKGTNGGISAAAYPDLDIKNLSADDIQGIYYRDWWLKYGLGKFASWSVGAKLFDAAINIGIAPAITCLQRALQAHHHPVAEDGALGPQTLEAANAILPYSLLPALRSELAAHYRLVIAKNPADARFESDWLGRAYS